jgi:uncharacterized membrane protein
MRKDLLAVGIIFLTFAIGIYFYSQLPEMIASHWDAQGKVNGYMPKSWGLSMVPLISIILFLFFILIPRIDPLKKNIKKFRKYFDNFVLLILGLMLYLQIITILWNIGFMFDIIKLMSPALAVVFYYCGVLLENAKRNWFIGIRTPWTLSSEKVWEKTNRLGGKMFKIVGIVSLFGILFSWAIFLMLFLAIAAAAYLFVYSYLEYKKTGHH